MSELEMFNDVVVLPGSPEMFEGMFPAKSLSFGVKLLTKDFRLHRFNKAAEKHSDQPKRVAIVNAVSRSLSSLRHSTFWQDDHLILFFKSDSKAEAGIARVYRLAGEVKAGEVLCFRAEDRAVRNPYLRHEKN